MTQEKTLNIPIPKKSEWPPTKDGTTDWEVLFENEEAGLFVIVSATTTPAQLKKITEDIIRAMYSRKNDKPVLAQLATFLEKLIPEDASVERLPAMQDGVRQLLGKIKDTRIQRAAAYVEKKNKQETGKQTDKNNNRRPNAFIGSLRNIADTLVFVFGFGWRKKAEDEETFFKQDAYVHQGGGDTEWQDTDTHNMEEAKPVKPGAFEDLQGKKSNGDKLESWDDYG